jgi:phosphate transport system substrate-binding protein
VKHYPPYGIEIATGSVDVRNFDYAQMFFVHRDNPLSSLTLAQLDAIFGEEHRRGPANIRTWGQLGLTGEWANQTITPYGWRIDDSFGIFLEAALLEGSHRWNNALHEFAHITRPDGTIYDHGQQILDALAADRYGIAVSNLRYARPEVKPLALAARDGGPAIAVTKENLITRKYPLTRVIPAYVDRPPGMPVDPKVREFLRYLLSREGQQDIVNDGGFLPLNAEAVAAGLKKLR